MEVGDWITLGAVIVALGIGVTSILHTQSLQKRERRERLLNEIIEWTIRVATSVTSFPTYAEIKDMWVYNIMTAGDESNRYESLERQGEYIRKIALKLEESLGNAVEEVMSNIKERQILLLKLMTVKPAIEIGETKKTAESMLRELEKLKQYWSSKNPKTWDSLSEEGKAHFSLGENAGRLKKSVSKVIEKATELKTKDIG
jgi:DNA-directed RNA polymerase subunit F